VWFLLSRKLSTTVDVVLDETLLVDDRTLEHYDLMAVVARCVLGDTIELALDVLKAKEQGLAFSKAVMDLLAADKVPIPSRRSALYPAPDQTFALQPILLSSVRVLLMDRFVLFHGGPPALRFASSVVGAVGYQLVLDRMDSTLSTEQLLAAHIAGEHFDLNEAQLVSLITPDLYIRGRAVRREDADAPAG
jgi:hypothetical protein